MPDFLPSTERLPGSYGVRLSLWSFYLSESAISPDSWWATHHDTLFIRGFLELCSIIEAAVLFENVYTDLGWDLTPLNYSSIAKELQSAGVLKSDSLVVAAHDGKARPSTRDTLTRLQGQLLTDAESDALGRKEQSLADALELDLVTEVSTLFSGLTYKPLVLRQMTSPIELVPASVESELLRLYARTVELRRLSRAPFKCRWADLPERRMLTPLVIEHLDESTNSILASPLLANWSPSSLFTVEKKLSITALS